MRRSLQMASRKRTRIFEKEKEEIEMEVKVSQRVRPRHAMETAVEIWFRFGKIGALATMEVMTRRCRRTVDTWYIQAVNFRCWRVFLEIGKFLDAGDELQAINFRCWRVFQEIVIFRDTSDVLASKASAM